MKEGLLGETSSYLITRAEDVCVWPCILIGRGSGCTKKKKKHYLRTLDASSVFILCGSGIALKLVQKRVMSFN